MSKTAQVTLTIIAVMLLFVSALVGGFFYWLSQNRETLKQSQTAGLAYGKQTDDHGCWHAALRRQPLMKDYKDTVGNNSFLLACLAAATNPPGFCDKVPQPGELLTTTRWSWERCRTPELEKLSQNACQSLLHTLQTYCSEYYKQQPANTNQLHQEGSK
jgi:hypothetical protein